MWDLPIRRLTFFLMSFLLTYMKTNKHKPQRLTYSQGNKNLCILTNSFTVLWMNWQKALHTFIISMYAIMLCSRVAKSLSSSSSRRLRSCSPSDRYLCRHATQKNLFTVHNEFHGVDMKTVMQHSEKTKTKREKKKKHMKININHTGWTKTMAKWNLSIISWGPWSMPMPSRSNITASKKASSQNCTWSQSVERSLPRNIKKTDEAPQNLKSFCLHLGW